MQIRTYPKWQYLCLGLLALFVIAYEAGPAWDQFVHRLTVQPYPVEQTLTILLNLVTPIFTVLLGFSVAIIRPRDPRAWLLLAVLLSMGEGSREGVNFATRSDEWRIPATWYNELGESWGIWLFLFMLYFPDRLEIDRRYPWLKWLLIAPSVSIAIMGPASQLGWPIARDYLSTLGGWLYLIAYSFAALLYGLLGYRYFSARNADDRRRLRLIFWGTVVSLVPQLVLIMIRNLSGHRNMDFVPGPVRVGALLMTFMFPLTLAYVILVHRALDLRVVIRQGIQYALATKGVLVLQIIAIFAIILPSTTLAADVESNRPQRITLIAAGVVFVFLIRRIADRVRRWLDRRFFREAYRAEQILGGLAEDVRTIIETRPLLETLARRISESLHVPRIAVLVLEGRMFSPAYAFGYGAPQESVAEDAPTITRLRDSRRALRVNAATVDELASFHPEVLLPLASRDKLLGIVILGQKQSEEPYSPSDLQLLESVAAQTGLALENSLLAEASQWRPYSASA